MPQMHSSTAMSFRIMMRFSGIDGSSNMLTKFPGNLGLQMGALGIVDSNRVEIYNTTTGEGLAIRTYSFDKMWAPDGVGR